MNKSAKSLLLAAMISVAGSAVAQAAAPTNDVKSGTQGGAGPSASEKAAPAGMPPSRAEVKAQAAPMKSGTDGGAGPMGKSGVGDNSPSTASRAAVKSEAAPMKAGTDGGAGPNASKKALTSAERKAQRAEASAARKARVTGKAGNPPMKEGKSAL